MRNSGSSNPYDDYSDLRETYDCETNNPARFLHYCSESEFTPTAASIIAGMHDCDRLDCWIEIAADIFSPDARLVRKLNARRVNLVGDAHPDIESDIGGSADSTPSRASSKGTEDAVDETAADAETAGSSVAPDVTSDEGDTSQSERPANAGRTGTEQERYGRARDLAGTMDVDRLRDRLDDERERDDPRPAVVEALEDELAARDSDPDSDTSADATDATGEVAV